MIHSDSEYIKCKGSKGANLALIPKSIYSENYFNKKELK